MSKLFENLIKEILNENNEVLSDMVLNHTTEYYNATRILNEKHLPIGLQIVKLLLTISTEYKLTAFFNTCMFYEVKNEKKLNTAGVIPWNTPYGLKTVFLYYKPFVDSLGHYYYDKNEISDQEFLVRYSKNPDDPRLEFDVSRLLFLFAHEGMHIFRNHKERQQAQEKKHRLYNIAADAVINHTLSHTIKQIAGYDINMIEGGVTLDKQEYLKWLKDKKYINTNNEEEDEFKKYLNADKTYEFYDRKKDDEEEPRKLPPEPVKVGDIRKITQGQYKDNYVKVKKVNKDGTYESEIVDLDEIVAEARKRYKEAKKVKNLQNESKLIKKVRMLK